MRKTGSYRILSILLGISVFFQQSVFASIGPAELNVAGFLPLAACTRPADKFRPLHLRSISYDLRDERFSLLLDKGDNRSLKKQEIEAEARNLLDYFFVGISLPDDAFWVNLRPDSPHDIIDPLLGKTGFGRILLEADLQLKKDTARATDPRTPEGREYWDKLYHKAAELYGTQDMVIPTLTRPWIVPDEIVISESGDSAYIYKATLKVMLEQDRLTGDGAYSFTDPREKELNEYSSRLIRETIIPKLTREINAARRYAPLRQVYYSLILARCFKASHGGLPVKGREADGRFRVSYSVAEYYNAYKESFFKGEYRIKAPLSTVHGQELRSYTSGGISFVDGGTSSTMLRGRITARLPVGFLAENPHILSLRADNSGNEVTLVEALPPRPADAVDLRDGGALAYKDQLKTIRDLLSTVDGKKVKRSAIKKAIFDQLLSIAREGEPLFSRRSYAEMVARLRDLGARLSRLEFLILAEAENGGDDKYLFNEAHISTIMQSSRGDEEIKGVIKALRELHITEGAHLSQILQSSRKEQDIRAIIRILEDSRIPHITEGAYAAMVLHSSRPPEEIEGLIGELKGLGITEAFPVASILYSGRAKEDIPDLVMFLRGPKMGMRDNSHIANILRSSRGKEEIERVAAVLKGPPVTDPAYRAGRTRITDPAHIAQVLQTSRSPEEIDSLITALQDLKITTPAHVVLILRTSRGQAEIVSLTGQLSDAGIADSAHLAAIVYSGRDELQIMRIISGLGSDDVGITNSAQLAAIIGTSRKEEDIPGLVELLKKLKIKEPSQIALILRSKRKPKEIVNIVKVLREEAGIESNTAIAMILYSSRKLPKIISMIDALSSPDIGIREDFHLALVLQSSRKESELKGLVEFLRSEGINDEQHLALILSCSRDPKQIRNVVGRLKKGLGITEGSVIATILHTSREEGKIAELVDALRKAGVTGNSHLAAALQGKREVDEIGRIAGELWNVGITEGAHLSRILGSGRDEAGIYAMINTLIGVGIVEPYHISLVLRSGRKKEDIGALVGMLRNELGMNENFHIAKILATSRSYDDIRESVETLKGLGITGGYYISLILHTSRTKAEIKDLVRLRDIIVQKKGGEYPETFIRDMLIGFSFMEDPLPLLDRILSTDFERVRLEIEGMPLNTAPVVFRKHYGEMAVWILKYFGKDFRFLSSFIRGYAVGFLHPESMEMLEDAPAPDDVEEQIEQLFLRELLERAIGSLGGEPERQAAMMYLDGYSEEEIALHYPDVSMSGVFEQLKYSILNDEVLRGHFGPFTEYSGFGGGQGSEGVPGAAAIASFDGGRQREKDAMSPFGGIDLRTLPATRAPVIVQEPDVRLSAEDIAKAEAELTRIRAMIDAGIIPSIQRFRECARRYLSGRGSRERTGKVLNCIADIFRLEEDRVSSGSGDLESLLALLGSAG